MRAAIATIAVLMSHTSRAGQVGRSIAVTAAVVATGILGLAAQDVRPAASGQRTPRALRSSIELTAVTVTVRDEDGRLVRDLPVDAFTIFEDGEPQTITQYAHERVPVGLGLLLDISDSMYGQRIKEARAAVERFLLELLSPDDALFVMTFNHQPHVLISWTPPDQATAVRSALDTLRPFGGTAVYDAVLHALTIMDHRPRDRSAIVIISDGADTASDTTLRDLKSALVRADAFVYAVAIDSPDRQAINARVNAEALGEITGQTGGSTEVVHTTADLAAATARIAEELNTQYVLGYSSPHPGDGKYHSIRVKVNREGYRARARNGYISVPVRSTGR
jgi:Ca-activated chloride channel family protein